MNGMNTTAHLRHVIQGFLSTATIAERLPSLRTSPCAAFGCRGITPARCCARQPHVPHVEHAPRGPGQQAQRGRCSVRCCQEVRNSLSRSPHGRACAWTVRPLCWTPQLHLLTTCPTGPRRLASHVCRMAPCSPGEGCVCTLNSRRCARRSYDTSEGHYEGSKPCQWGICAVRRESGVF